MSKRPFDGTRAVKRTLAVTATAALAVTGAAFGSAATANAVDTVPNTVSVTSAAQWTKAGDPSAFDYTTNANGSVRFANDLQNQNLYGAIQQLNTPVVQDAGEGTDNNTFTEEFTLGAESYNAQPGLAIEVDADKDGNRGGGNLLLREDSNHVLSLASFFVPEGSNSDDVSDWIAKTADVDFTQPVNIKYVDHFVTGGQDIVKVYVNGELKISGSTFEGYYDVEGQGKQAVNSILLRTGYRKADPSGFGWTDETPTPDQAAALQGKGFDFSNIKLTSSDDVAVPTATATKVQVADIGAETDAGYPSANALFVGQAPEGETAGTPTATGATLNVPATTQILHGFAADARPTDLTSFIDSGLSWVQDGTGSTGAFFQIPVGYGAGHFTTLRPLTVTPGINTAGWDQQWVSSNGQFTGTLGQIVDQLDALGNTSIYGFGVYAQDATGVTSIQAGTTKYTFANDPAVTVNSVTVTGTAAVGQTLTAHVDASATTGTTTTYQWYKGSAKITGGGTSSTYTIAASSLIGQQLSVKVTVAKTGFTTGTGTSAKTAKVVAGTITGSVAMNHADTEDAFFGVGQALTASVESSPTTTVAYTWYRNTTKISGATKATYTPTASDLGKNVHVHAVLSASGYTSLVATSTPQLILAGEFNTAPTIIGTLKVGSTITARINASVASVTGTYYEFLSIPAGGDEEDGIVVQSGSSATYLLSPEDQGNTIEVFTIASKNGYLPEFGVSAASAVIQ